MGRRGAFLHRDQVRSKVAGPSRGTARRDHFRGAIPENASYQVVAEPEGVVVGTLARDFAVESLPGISSSWARPRGASRASEPAACGSRMRMALLLDSLLRGEAPAARSDAFA